MAPTGLEFISGDVYPELGDSLLVCEWNTSEMHALRLGGPNEVRVLEDRVVSKDCQLDIVRDPRGIVHYSNDSEIRRLLPD